jgi:branched-chain amino acid transport system permease protein
MLSGLLLVGIASAVLPSPMESYPMYVVGLAGINVILAVSLHIVNGLTGQFSLGHAGFMAVGGYTAALFGTKVVAEYKLLYISEPVSDTILFFFATLLGGVAAGIAGLLVGLPSLRLRGDYLAIVTLGFAEIIRVTIENVEVLGAATGLVGIPPLTSLFWIFFWASVTVLYAKRLQECTHGRALLAIREDEIAAEAMGVDTTGYKVRAFVASSFFAGVAGALLGYYLTILTPKDFTFLKSVEVVVMVVLGGMGSASGAILAAILLTVLPEALRPLREHTGVDLRMVIYASLLLLMMLLRPRGILGRREVWTVLRRRREGEPEVAP